MFSNLNGWHLVIILAVVLLMFGAPRLPALAKSMGQSMRIFRGEVKTLKQEEAGSGEDAVADADTDADAVTPVSSTAGSSGTP